MICSLRVTHIAVLKELLIATVTIRLSFRQDSIFFVSHYLKNLAGNGILLQISTNHLNNSH